MQLHRGAQRKKASLYNLLKFCYVISENYMTTFSGKHSMKKNNFQFIISISVVVLFCSYMLYGRTKVCPHEVLIGPDGFLYGGYYNSWKMFGTKLGGIKLIQGNNTAIEFDIQVRGKYGYASHPLRVPEIGRAHV